MEYPAKPGNEPPPHWHEVEDETLYVLEGEMEAYLDHEVLRIGPGEALFIPHGEPHGCFSRRQLSYFASSIMGQCLYFLQSRPIIERLNPDFKIGKAEIAEIAEHITRFSLAAVAELTRQLRRS